MNEEPPNPRDLLNAQTGRIQWSELERPFAMGRIVYVEKTEDLVGVAKKFVEDDAPEIERLRESGLLRRATDKDAMRWNDGDTEFWAVVVAPWVLVQKA